MSSITPRQQQFICDLLDQRNLLASPKFFDTVNAMDHEEYAQFLTHMKTVQVPTLTKQAASKWIEQLLKLPKNQPTATKTGPWKVQAHTYENDPKFGDETMLWMQRVGGKAVPRGSYAIERSSLRNPGAFTNDMLFFSVWIDDKPLPDGDYKWSVKMYVSDERVKISRSLQYDVLDAIGQAPGAAATRYGLEKCRCGICGRKLTKDESRERGIGPVCAEKWGW